jgi:hypothetical protein
VDVVFLAVPISLAELLTGAATTVVEELWTDEGALLEEDNELPEETVELVDEGEGGAVADFEVERVRVGEGDEGAS